jgi:hypothetical protein
VSSCSKLVSLDATPVKLDISSHDSLVKPRKEDGPIGPHFCALIVCADFCRKTARVADTLEDASNVSCDAQLVHFFGYTDVRVREGGIVDDHVFVLVRCTLFQTVCWS